jgi:hypothetical protein
MDYPAQLNPPLEEQPIPLGLVRIVEFPITETADSFLCVLGLAHLGQAEDLSPSEKGTIFSKVSPHSLHSYS